MPARSLLFILLLFSWPAFAEETKTSDPMVTTTDCTSYQSRMIVNAVINARRALRQTNAFLSTTHRANPVVKAYFGAGDSLRILRFFRLKRRYARLEEYLATRRINYICVQEPSEDNTLAEAELGLDEVYLYGGWFRKVPENRAVILIHEASHILLDTDDLGYYRAALKLESKEQLINADNFEQCSQAIAFGNIEGFAIEALDTVWAD